MSDHLRHSINRMASQTKYPIEKMVLIWNIFIGFGIQVVSKDKQIGTARNSDKGLKSSSQNMLHMQYDLNDLNIFY